MQWGEKYTKMRSHTARKFIARKHFYKIAKILLQIEGGISNIKIDIEYFHVHDVLYGVRLSFYEITVFTQTYLLQHCNSHFN